MGFDLFNPNTAVSQEAVEPPQSRYQLDWRETGTIAPTLSELAERQRRHGYDSVMGSRKHVCLVTKPCRLVIGGKRAVQEGPVS
jgi:hypothetical protein